MINKFGSILNAKELSVFVSGRVLRPGKISVSRTSSLNDAIDIAGGAKVLKEPVRFLRFNNDGNIDKRKFKLRKRAARGGFNNPYLKEGDLIIVGNNIFTATNEVVQEFTAPFIGLFSTYGFIKAISD